MSLPRYEAYTDSGVPFLGMVPSHWRVEALKRRVDVMPSNVDKKIRDDERTVRLCNYTDVYYNSRITEGLSFMVASASDEQIARFSLRAGDVIITKDSETADDIAVSALVPGDLPGIVCGYHLALLRQREGARGEFVKYLFDAASTKAAVATRANGLTRVGLSQYALDSLELPFPPVAEQMGIAAFLDRETAKIDALIAEQERLVALLDEKRQAVITQAVTKGLEPSVPMRDTAVEWMGTVPAHWTQSRLGRVCLARCDGPFGSGIRAEHYREAGVRVIRLQNIKALQFADEDKAFLDPAYVDQELQGHDVVAGDVLIAGLGDDRNLVGRACVAPPSVEPALVKADCFRFRVDLTRALPSFVALQLCAGAAADAGTLSTGSTRSRIPLSVMSSRTLVLPPLDEQAAIVNHVQEFSSRHREMVAQSQHIIGLLRERRAALISAAVTGQIDVRGLASSEAT